MTIEDVAARAGVGKASIYRRWPTKGTLALDAFLVDFLSRQPPVDNGALEDDLREALTLWSRVVGTPTDERSWDSWPKPSTTRFSRAAGASEFSLQYESSIGKWWIGR